MKLKKLEVTGFKSFLEKTSISFPPGVSAIVGPNGCGKSNIIDALRWVMGEQSIKQLRGKSMEDIIFLGADGKPPLNMAEVSLTLNNENGSGPAELKDFTEIMVTRRFFRSGESAYFINKQPCRLKDIHNIFMGSGMGAKTFAVIQQGKIERITDAGPDERRFFIEEAAGISRYKSRKIEALRKVEATKQNLSRVLDIIAEVERQMRSLKRQAKKAEIFKNFRGRARKLDVLISLRYFDDYTQQLNQMDTVLKALQDEDFEHASKIKLLDAAIEKIKLHREQKSQDISEQRNHQFETRRNADRMENDIAHLKEDLERLADEIRHLDTEHQELKRKNTDITSEISKAKNEMIQLEADINKTRSRLDQETSRSQKSQERLSESNRMLESYKSELMDLVTKEARYKNIYQNASNNKESLNRRIKKIDLEVVKASKSVTVLVAQATKAKEQMVSANKEKTDLIKQTDTIRDQLVGKIDQLGRQVKSVQKLEYERNQAKSKYSALKKMEENFEWYRDGVKAIMTAHQTEQKSPAPLQPEAKDRLSPDIIGLMADIIVPEPSFEMAVEAVLGESLQYMLIKDQQSGIESIAYLQRTGAGRSGFIPVSSVRPLASSRQNRPDRTKLLLNHITIKPGYEKISEALLGHVVVTDDIEEAINVWNRNGVKQTIVTKGGDLITHQGIIFGGCKEKLSGILAKKHELRELKNRIRKMDHRLEAMHRVQKELETAVRTTENRLQQMIEKKHQAEQKEIEAEKSFYKASEDLKHARRHLEIIGLEQEQLTGEESDIDEEMANYQTALTAIEKEIRTAQNHVSETSEKIRAATSEMERVNQRIVDLKLERTRSNAKLENSRHTLNRLQLFHADSLKQIEQRACEMDQKKQKIARLQEKRTDNQRSLSNLYDEIKRIEEKLEQDEADFHAIDAKLKENDDIISGIQNQREQILEKIRLLELEKSQQQIQRENISNRLKERYGRSLIELKSTVYAESDDASNPLERLREIPTAEMEDELAGLRKKMDKIGDVHMGAIAEYDQLKSRFAFLSTQRDDLVKAIDDLYQVIKKINKITRERFIKTFHLINEKLGTLFPRLFEGGSAKLVLTQPDNLLETGVEFLIHPPGKRLTRMSLLSGGEKALSAIAFISSIYLIKPASFCLMDEIDAPLDEANIFRFNDLLKIIGEKSQIVLITHNKRSMEFADTLFGITMEHQGISKLVSVNFERAKE